MKESIGGAFMLRILIVFVVVYVTFIGIALNIAKAYRIKSGVINILEQYQFDFVQDKDKLLGDDGPVDKYLKSIPYTVKSTDITDKCEKYTGDETIDKKSIDSSRGICIIKKGDNEAPFYKVVVFMFVEIPFLEIDGIAIPVSGETMTIYSK